MTVRCCNRFLPLLCLVALASVSVSSAAEVVAIPTNYSDSENANSTIPGNLPTDQEAGYDDQEEEPYSFSTNFSTAQARTLAYLPKPFALISMICSYGLLREVTTDQRSNKGGPIPRVLFSMAVFDIFFSFGYFLGNWPFPPDTQQGSGVHQWGSIGFCSFQGFIVQFGFVGSVLANAVLSLYFLLVVRYGWSDSRLTKKEPYAQGVVWVSAAVMAIYPLFLEIYNPNEVICMINGMPLYCTGDQCTRGIDVAIPQIFNALLPILGIFWTIYAMIRIWKQVRHIENQAKKYSTTSFTDSGLNSATSSSLQLQGTNDVNRKKSIAVAKQGIFYGLVFLFTYSVATITAIIFYITGGWYSHILSDLAYCVMLPSAGLFNFIVFARPGTNFQMKTPEGRWLRKLLFCSCCFGEREKKSALGKSTLQSKNSNSQLENNKRKLDVASGLEESKLEEGEDDPMAQSGKEEEEEEISSRQSKDKLDVACEESELEEGEYVN